jgi:hypothetical protein
MKVRPLSPREAKGTILNRIAPVVDRARQVAVKTGLRSHRVFLVWTLWSGAARGEGDEREVARMEVLPTPRVEGLDAVALKSFSAGILPEGSIRLRSVSVRYTEEQLRGRVVPPNAERHEAVLLDPLPPNVGFFYEVFEDGRGDALPVRQKYRLASQVWHQEGKVAYTMVLERISEDSTVEGPSRFAPGGAYG